MQVYKIEKRQWNTHLQDFETLFVVDVNFVQKTCLRDKTEFIFVFSLNHNVTLWVKDF